jgi:N-acetyl sugar amidotransferase
MSSSKLVFCSRCVCDGSMEEIVLDKDGVCNFCHIAQRELIMAEEEKPNLDKWIKKIKKDGKGEKYDCIIGLSGGIDSSTALYWAVQHGLRPLCFSVDNGYQSDSAQENIMRLVEGMKVPFYRYNIDLNKFADLQNAFLKAGLINAEIPTDHILMATTYEMADKYNCKWIISGGNVSEESIMPGSWSFSARDLVHIKDVYKRMTGRILKGLPIIGLLKWNWMRWIKGIKVFYILDYLDYKSSESKKLLSELYGWQDYGLKHEESTFTKWFQNFYLFQKFGIDKRKAHFSSLINSGQMTRGKAMNLLLVSPVYPELGIESKVMKYQKRSHYDFKTDEKLWKFLTILVRVLRKPYRKLMKTGKAMKA